MRRPCKTCVYHWTGGIKDGKHNDWCCWKGAPASKSYRHCKNKGGYTPKKRKRKKMNTHDIETILRNFLTGDGYIAADDIPAICTIIEADWQARGEPVKSIWQTDPWDYINTLRKERDALAKAASAAGFSFLKHADGRVQMVPQIKGEAQSEGEYPAEPVGEVLGETCIDGGKCHHGCEERCFRRQCCDPFSDYSGPWKYAAEADSSQSDEPVKINAIFETEDGECIGTTDAKIKRIEYQDDGSFTVVIDYWPQSDEPMRCRGCGYLVTDMEHQICVKAAQLIEPESCFCDRMYPDSNPDASCGDCPIRDYGVKTAEPDSAKCAECGAELIPVRPGKWQHPDCSQSPWASEPVAWPIASPEDADKGWILDYRFLEQVERIASQRTNYTTSMEATEQVLIAANEVLRASQTTEPVSKTDWSNELSSWSDEDFIRIFHEHPDLANRLRKMLADPVKEEIFSAARDAGYSFAKGADGVTRMIPLIKGEAHTYDPKKPTEQEWKILAENGRKAWGTKPTEPVNIDVDDLAQEIRRVDGNNALGAGALAEALMPFLERVLQSQDRADADRLDWLREETCDLRCINVPTGGDDYDVRWVVIQHHMSKPHEREIGRSFTDDPRDAIDHARRIGGGNHE